MAGLGSVLWWHEGEVRGHGDLRPYALVQFYPLVAVRSALASVRAPVQLWAVPFWRR
jgi:hypothetical protein